ncbi:MAG: VOC family protein [candidate division NC10 bacterium]
MAKAAKPIPEGFHSVTPHLIVRNAAQAIDFYTKAFAAQELSRMPGPDGKLLHAEIKIGDSILMLCDEFPHWNTLGPQSLGASAVGIHIYVQDADALFTQAVTAGATVKMPIEDTFWGDRFGKVTDPFGHEWSIATRKRDLTPEELHKGAQDYFSSAAGG